MKRTKKILILLAAVGAMCGVVAGFLPAFQDAFTVKPHRTVSLPTETVSVWQVRFALYRSISWQTHCPVGLRAQR